MNHQDDSNQRLYDNTALAVRVGVGLVGNLLGSLAGQPVVGALVGATAEPAGLLANHIIGILTEVKAHRAADSFRRIWERLKEKDVTPSPGALNDLLVEAASVLGDAETEEKRRLIENLIVNAAQTTELKTRTEAQSALSLIQRMSPGAAFLFGAAAAQQIAPSGNSPDPGIRVVSDAAGLDLSVGELGFEDLHRLNLFGSVSVEETRRKIGVLNERGLWLLCWIMEHPPKPVKPTVEPLK